MKLIYTPAGSEKSFEYPFRPGKLQVAELEMIEQRTGMLYDEWTIKVHNASAIAINAFLFVMRRREQPDLQWHQLVWTMDEIELDLDEEETRTVIRRLQDQLKEMETADAPSADRRAQRERISELCLEIGDPDPYAEDDVETHPSSAGKKARPKGQSRGSAATSTTSRS